MLQLADIEYRILTDGLIREEQERFKQIAKLADDRSRWTNEFAHVEDCHQIAALAGDIIVLASRREMLRTRRQTDYEPPEHS